VRAKLVRVVALWLAVLAGLGGLAVRAAPAAHADTGSEEAQFLSLTNSLRAGLGLQALTPHGELTSVARSWSAHMAAAGAISHNGDLPNQVSANWTQLGENVGTGGTVDAIQTAFINSHSHYENLVKGAYNYVGIGVVHGSNGAIYVTVDFMAAAGGAAPAPAPAPKATTPKATAPRATAPAAPRATTPRGPSAPATTAPPAPAPAPAPSAIPVGVKGSPALTQVLAELRALDVSS
jgi:cysteine-rich secretory family protein